MSSGEVGSPDLLIRLYRQLYCVSMYPQISLVKSNDFTDIAAYLLQKVCYYYTHTIMYLFSGDANSHIQCKK